RFWPAYPNGRNPLGLYILIGADPQPVEIVGIAADVRQAGLDADVRPGVYRPCAQNPPLSAMFAVRTEGDPLWLVNAVRREVLAIDPAQPISAVKTMEDVIESSMGQRRLTMVLLGMFACVALLLAIVGIYGAIAYSVSRRKRELGIRRALGARQSAIIRLVVGHVLGLTLAGILIGMAGALALTRVIEGLLFDISPTDPAVFLAIAVLFIGAALAAGYIPALRASRIDPMSALRDG
ncbi:MAG: FtsX-like permease family protein, partial [Bryobacteraceae bacterium]